MCVFGFRSFFFFSDSASARTANERGEYTGCGYIRTYSDRWPFYLRTQGMYNTRHWLYGIMAQGDHLISPVPAIDDR